MFERYTEPARRALFFSRYEASLLGSLSIETEHLLLGLIREEKGLASRILERSLENIRNDIEGRTVSREKVATSVEIPFSAETKQALQSAADEADHLLHNDIGTEHLLLGMLREESSLASDVLRKNGFELSGVRTQIVALRQTQRGADGGTYAELAEEIGQLQSLAERLFRKVPDQAFARPLLEQITFALNRLREHFGP
jgi:ATP-dependent Clp protease ATP-binding subunit ClpC